MEEIAKQVKEGPAKVKKISEKMERLDLDVFGEMPC